MKGFKDTSKTVWLAGNYAKGGRVNGAAKVSKVMREFKSGELHSGAKDGPKVSSRKQAVAIALSEAGKTRKADGGIVGKLAAKNVMANRENAVLRGAVERGNRMAAEEQGSEAMVMRRPRGANEPMIQSNAPPRSLLDRKCGGGLASTPRMKK